MPGGVYKRTKQHGKNISKAKKGKRTSIATEFKKGHPGFRNNKGSLGKHWKLTEEQKERRQNYSISKQKLIDLYWYQKLSLKKIANYLKCSENVIFSRMKEYHIPLRSISEASIGKFVSRSTRKKLSLIAKKKTGVNALNWKGGISKDRNHKNNQQRKRYHRKYKLNPQYRLRNNMGKAIYKALKQNKASRNWEHLTGYTLEKLKQRLEYQFKEGMSWENYGQWHVDHKKPQSLFIYNSPEDKAFKDCWSLANLQPLWATDNIRKWNKFKP